MILVRSPLRVSLLGGMSDIPNHYNEYGGAVLSTAIDKYVYVSVMRTPQRHIKITYSKQELVTKVDDIQNEIVKNCLKYYEIVSNVEITTFADIPTVGSGLAGSSAFTCALVVALNEYVGNNEMDEYEIARVASYIELHMCGWRIGKQDQYASAFGGFNLITFRSNGIGVSKVNFRNIENNMILIPTNIKRHSSEILSKLNIEDKKNTGIINQLSDLAYNTYNYIQSSSKDQYEKYDEIVQNINLSWKLKKSIDGIINPEIDSICNAVSEYSDAVKLLGAGGGGYILALTQNKPWLRSKFEDCLDIKISIDGTKIINRG